MIGSHLSLLFFDFSFSFCQISVDAEFDEFMCCGFPSFSISYFLWESGVISVSTESFNIL